MQRLLSLLAAVLICNIYANAQNVITATNFNLVPGDNIETKSLTDTLSTTGGNGANQIWNYATLSGIYNSSVQYIVPPQILATQLFNNANLALLSRSAQYYEYYVTDVSGLRYLGYCDSNMSGRIVNNAHYMMRLPLSYNDDITEPINEEVVSTSGGSILMRKNGTVNWKVVGYGKLILPSGTFNNVLKVITTQIDTLQNYINNRTQYSISITTKWLYPGIHSSILQSAYERIYFSDDPVGMKFRSADYTTKTPLAVNEMIRNKYALIGYPNPATGDEINFRLKLEKSALITIRISTINGQLAREINNGRVMQGENVILPVKINNLTPGIYTADVTIDNTHIYYQFVKN